MDNSVRAIFMGKEDTLPMWLKAETPKDRRLLFRIISALADEATARMTEGDWDAAAPLVATGGNLTEFANYWQTREEDAEDEAV